jgi:hypothetical protein
MLNYSAKFNAIENKVYMYSNKPYFILSNLSKNGKR